MRMSEYMRNRRGEEAHEGFFCRFTFGQFFAILVLEVFTLFFVFYLGARYGREFLGLDAKPQTAALAEGEAAPAETGSGDEPRVPSTTDPDAAKMARELIEKAKTPELKDRIGRMFEAAQGEGKPPPAADRPPPEPAEEPALPPNREAPPKSILISGGEEKPISGEVSQQLGSGVAQGREAEPKATQGTAEEQPRAGETATQMANRNSKEQTSDTSAGRVKSVENARYAVQVGSYPQLAEATHSVEKWKGKGYPAYMMIADIPDRGRWYRVRIGGFSSREDASRYLKEFQSRENAEALIVMNEQ